MTGKPVEKVAIVGAGGRMGGFIIKALLSENKIKVTAITRPDSTSTMPAGVTVAKVDYSDSGALTAALKGHDALIITMNAQAPAESSIQLVEAAAAAGVAYVMPNWYGGDGTNEKLGNEIGLLPRFTPVTKRVEELGVSSWVALACSFWYEWSLGGPFGLGPNMYGFSAKDRTVTFFDDGETKINTTTWPQAGLAVARLFALPSEELAKFKNGYVYVSDFLLSQKDMFASLKRVTGTEDKDWTIDYEPSDKRYQDGLKGLSTGDRPAFAKMLYSRMFYPNNDGNYEAKHGLSNELLGLPKVDLDEATKRAIEFELNPF